MKIALVSVPVQDPIAAHAIYTKKLGFKSQEFDQQAGLAIVVSAADPDGTAIILEPCKGTFAENYQQSAYAANLPIMVFTAANADEELQRLAAADVTLRADLDRPDCGLTNLFEDGCGNLLMIQQAPA